jgi:chromosome segregation ATPase
VPTDGVADGNGDRNSAAMKHLEKTIQELETENAQLQDALEDMSQSINASHISASYNTSPHPKQQTSKTEARLREELVELKSRYEVTHARLEDSFVENHTLIEVLKKREKEERDMVQELTILQERLAASEAEVDSAKYIATSALVKIEQLRNGDSSKKSLDELYREKQHQIEQEMSTLI